MTLDEALNKIIDLENDKKTLNDTINSLNLQLDGYKEKDEKLTKDVERLQKNNMDLFLKVTSENNTLNNKIDNNLVEDDIEVKTIEELLQDF